MDRKQTRDAAFKETKDLAFASYAHMRGLKIIKATQWKKGTSIEYRFTFSDPPTDESPEGRWQSLVFDFANSESMNFDSSVRTLKKLCKSGRQD